VVVLPAKPPISSGLEGMINWGPKKHAVVGNGTTRSHGRITSKRERERAEMSGTALNW